MSTQSLTAHKYIKHIKMIYFNKKPGTTTKEN